MSEEIEPNSHKFRILRGFIVSDVCRGLLSGRCTRSLTTYAEARRRRSLANIQHGSHLRERQITLTSGSMLMLRGRHNPLRREPVLKTRSARDCFQPKELNPRCRRPSCRIQLVVLVAFRHPSLSLSLIREPLQTRQRKHR